LSQSYGLDWAPIQKVHLNAIFTDHETPPTVQQILSPPTFTPNVEIFDFVLGSTVFVRSIAGGAPNLRATDDRQASLGVSLGPYFDKTIFSAYYERHRIHDAVGTLPPLTPVVQLAFPDRFVRDVDGTLIEIDNRSVNLQRQDMHDLKWAFNAWFPFGPATKGGTPNRFEFSAFDTWVQKDDTLIRNGIPPLNLLNGAPSNGAGGQPRHQIDWTALVYKDGLGAALSGTWRSATSVSGGDAFAPESLIFSTLSTVNLRVFADLTHLPATRGEQWAQGARVALQVLNVADRRQSVQDSSGVTPVAFAPGYLDPVGRTVWLTLRKAFQ
jgi:iron complex outermembrane receptor protein